MHFENLMLKLPVPVTIICILLILRGYSQPLDYSYTSEGKLVFSEVITVEEAEKNDLFALAVESFSKENKVRKDKENKTIRVSRSYTFHEKGILSRTPYAEINYQLFLEFKDNRYRYQLKDFDFLPYARNRYGKYETVERKRKSLENVIQNDSDWKEQEEAFLSMLNSEIDLLKLTMQGNLPKKADDSVSQVIELKEEW
ncbi:hypothetical protein OKW21_003243 [Catalinimonas alkaloidigena]|nr:hypothetical protein [Catalinimonas alkaloidigena]